MATPTFFRADEKESETERPKPTPGDWFGTEDSKFRDNVQIISTENEGLDRNKRSAYDGWREFYQGYSRDALWNPLLSPDKKEEALRFRDTDSDKRSLVFILEHAAEIFENSGHDDLSAECEAICEDLSRG